MRRRPLVGAGHLACEVGERATGIEPAFSAWEARRGVLSDLRISGKVRFSPFTRDRWYSLLAPDGRGVLHEMEANRCVARCCTEPGPFSAMHCGLTD